MQRESLRTNGQKFETEKVPALSTFAGATPTSVLAIMNIAKIWQEHLECRYDLEVVDIYLHPGLAKSEQIIAVPTLIKKLPLPSRRFIDTMADVVRVLAALDAKPKAA